jgi:hypothetical protein
MSRASQRRNTTIPEAADAGNPFSRDEIVQLNSSAPFAIMAESRAKAKP